MSIWFVRYLDVLSILIDFCRVGVSLAFHQHFAHCLGRFEENYWLKFTQFVYFIILSDILSDFSCLELNWPCFHCALLLVVVFRQVRARTDSKWLGLFFSLIRADYSLIFSICCRFVLVFAPCHFSSSLVCRCRDLLARIDWVYGLFDFLIGSFIMLTYGDTAFHVYFLTFRPICEGACSNWLGSLFLMILSDILISFVDLLLI